MFRHLKKNSGTDRAEYLVRSLREGWDESGKAEQEICDAFTRLRKIEIMQEKELLGLCEEAYRHIDGYENPNSYSYIPPSKLLGALIAWNSIIDELELHDMCDVYKTMNDYAQYVK